MFICLFYSTKSYFFLIFKNSVSNKATQLWHLTYVLQCVSFLAWLSNSPCLSCPNPRQTKSVLIRIQDCRTQLLHPRTKKYSFVLVEDLYSSLVQFKIINCQFKGYKGGFWQPSDKPWGWSDAANARPS